jgi:hypothetical protein
MFWTNLADPKYTPLNALRTEVAEYLDQEGSSFREERTGLVIKAWWQYSHDEPVTAKTIALDTVVDKEGRTTLAETPLVGEVFGDVAGIDLGPQIIRG